MTKQRNLLVSLGIALIVTGGKTEYYEWKKRQKEKKLKRGIENLEKELNIIIVEVEAK